MSLPAVCDTCGAIFPQRGIVVQNSTVSMTNVRVGPCPKCGGTGHIPDGVYSIMGDVINVIQAPETSKRDLERIAAILRQAQQRKASIENVAEDIRREAPSLSSVADLLPQNRAELYAFLQLVLAAVMLYLALKSSSPSSPNITINQIINQVVIEAPQSTPTAQRPTPRAEPKSYRKEKRRTKKSDRQTGRR